MESLADSRNRFFHEAKQRRCENPWIVEMTIRGTQVDEQSIEWRKVRAWDPCAPTAHANCPELHERVLEVKGLVVNPSWRARVDTIYAGRGRFEDMTASSLKHRKGGTVYISFAYSDATVAALITLGDFVQFVDRAKIDARLGARSEALRDGMLAAFARLARGDREGSRIFMAPSHVISLAMRTTQWAELFIIAHELAHLIMKDSTQKPDKLVLQEVDALLAEPSVAVEIQGLSESQKAEVRADVLSLLIVAGEDAGDATLTTEMQAIDGATLALLGVGIVDADWSGAGDHPSTLTRLAVISRIAARRILSRSELTLDQREELVRSVVLKLVYAAWLSGVRIDQAHTQKADVWRNVVADFAAGAAALLVENELESQPLFVLA